MNESLDGRLVSRSGGEGSNLGKGGLVSSSLSELDGMSNEVTSDSGELDEGSSIDFDVGT